MRKVFLVGGVLMAVAVGQQPMATVGRVVDAAGAPVVGAEVVFASSPPLVDETFSPAEVVRATSDADGRYRAGLRTGRSYTGWAVGPAAQGGGTCSEYREGVLAGEIVEFALGQPVDGPLLHVDGLDELGDGGPFVLQLRAGGRHSPVWTLPIASDGSVEVPRLPPGGVASILDARGAVRVGVAIRNRDHVGVPPARRIRCIVRDENGQPIAGALVGLVATATNARAPEPFGDVGAFDRFLAAPPTGADGRTELVAHDPAQALLATAAGRVGTLTGRVGGHWVQDGQFRFGDPQKEAPLPDEFVFVLPRAEPLRGRLHRGEQPVVGIGVLAVHRVAVAGAMPSGVVVSSSVCCPQTTATAADGGFTFASPPGPFGGVRFAFAPLPGDDALLVLRPRQQRPEAPLDIDLATWPVTALQLLDTTGGPPAAARCVVWPADSSADDEPIVVPTDRAGRARLRLEPGEWLLFATDGAGAALEVLTVAARGSAAPRSFALEPLPKRAGRVLDGEGKPVAGVRFRFAGSRSEREPQDAPPLERELRRHCRAIADGLAQAVRSDADGRFVLRFVEVPGVKVLGGVEGSTEVVTLEEGEELVLHAVR